MGSGIGSREEGLGPSSMPLGLFRREPTASLEFGASFQVCRVLN